MSISSRCLNKPMDCPLADLPVLIWSASTFSSASLSWSKRSTDTGTQLFTGLSVLTLVLSQPNKTPLSISSVSKPGGCSLSTGLPVLTIGFLVFGRVCWESSLTSSNFWTQFFHPTISNGNLWRKSRWRIYFLVYDFSSFHHNSFRDTVSWECVVKDDCVRSCLIELKSFLLSKFDVDPKSALRFLLFLLMVPCKTRCFRSMLFGYLCSLFIGSTDVKNTVCLLLNFCPPNQSWICDRV